MSHKRKISVIGLGYVGLPAAAAFARSAVPVVGYDIDERRIAELARGHDRTGEVEPAGLAAASLRFSASAKDLAAADFHIVTVPTPIHASKQPNLEPLKSASTTIGSVLKPGDIVVYESTVYPGVTEEICIPALESASGRWSDAAAQNPDDPLGAVLAFYLSGDHREEKMDGCPIVALGSDAARQGPDVKAAFEAGIKAHLEVLSRFIAAAGGEASSGKAMAILSTMVGAVTLSRAVNDPDLAQALLDAAVEQVRDAAAA